MRNTDLARDYIHRAEIRLRALEVLFEAESWADVVRESQEIVELTLKALLRASGIDPPRIHDVSGVMLAERERLPKALSGELETLTRRGQELAVRHLRDAAQGGLVQAGQDGLPRPVLLIPGHRSVRSS